MSYLSKKIISAFIILISLTLAGCSGKVESKPVASTSLKSTVISPHMEVKLEKDKNMVYCSTFQLAWNELKENIIKEDIKLNGEQAVTEALNKSLSKKKDLSDKDYIAKVGFKKDNILEAINKEMNAKFSNKFGKVTENLQREDDIFAYAFLYKNLEFEKEFEALKEPLKFNDKDNIKAFGIKEVKYDEKIDELIKQVDILDYKSDEDFIIRLNSKVLKDEIILANIEPKEDMLSLIKDIDSRIKNDNIEKLKERDSLVIPCIDFDIKHSFDNLVRKSFLNKGFEEYTISKASQDIKFTLNEKGAELKSEARIGATKSAANVSKPKKLVFNKPFALIMREKGSDYPYFVMWIENSELLVKK